MLLPLFLKVPKPSAYKVSMSVRSMYTRKQPTPRWHVPFYAYLAVTKTLDRKPQPHTLTNYIFLDPLRVYPGVTDSEFSLVM